MIGDGFHFVREMKGREGNGQKEPLSEINEKNCSRMFLIFNTVSLKIFCLVWFGLVLKSKKKKKKKNGERKKLKQKKKRKKSLPAITQIIA